MTLFGVGIVALVGTFFWLNGQQDSAMSDDPVPIGTTVKSVQLEDSRTGQTLDLGQYVGKKDIVLVAYMGEFCPGCSELVGELQRRAPEFEAANAQLVVLGYEVGKTGRDTAAKHSVTSYPLLQEGSPNTFTRSIGMWSDMMEMPWMGYVIVDKSGKIVAGEQTGLSEARGAAPKNVDKLLSSLASARASATGG
jgi:peroxiredoxin